MTARRKLTLRDKLEILVQQGRCPLCSEKLGELEGLDFDHDLALVNGGSDTNGNMRAVHRDCHDKKTNGPGGERRITTAGSDKHTAMRTRNLSEDHLAFQRRMTAPTPAEDEPPRKGPKTKWPKRPFPKRPKESRR